METRPKAWLLALSVACAAAACASDPDDGTGTTNGSANPGDGGSQGGAGAGGASGGGSAAGGSSDGGGGAGSVGSADCTGDAPTNSDDLISNFEDGTVGVNQVAGRGGGFYIFNDKMNDKVAQTATVDPIGRCSDGSSSFSYCTKGSGFSVWGAGFGTDLGVADTTAGTKSTVDLSAYTGVSFWIIRKSGTAATAKLIVADKNTAEEGGVCSNAAGTLDKDKCDPYVANVPLSGEWTKQTVKFTSLKQGGWGKPSPMFAQNAVYSIQLQFGPMIDFDVCFDQLVLVR